MIHVSLIRFRPNPKNLKILYYDYLYLFLLLILIFIEIIYFAESSMFNKIKIYLKRYQILLFQNFF